MAETIDPILFSISNSPFAKRCLHERATRSILLANSLGVGFAVGVGEFLAAFLPRLLSFRRGDVPVGTAIFFGDGAEVRGKSCMVGRLKDQQPLSILETAEGGASRGVTRPP